MNTHLNDLLGYKKKKTRHLFRWKVVEAYRAERVQASELEETLGIPLKELRRLNRNYFRLRLLPLLQPQNRRKTMKRDADYVKTLERKLADMEKENQFLRLQAEAYQTVIQIAEEQFNIPIVKKPGARRPKN
ncbi:hypothetical protein [Spirosoma linguale]|uniref:Transposase n=1 Tax=Spirosoma linguale (strain ATCC 33905 / DSM 74 / LMG 10896 / Claus 1) TaxID=504472 RepID=D2QC81_SPILD|nr:hypothetical protein Slin_0120 [Spirosoma linguale DSM 74]ADB39614.1 hypothetical protein Slin_3607 [Spirosoma linguale DSM 74]